MSGVVGGDGVQLARPATIVLRQHNMNSRKRLLNRNTSFTNNIICDANIIHCKFETICFTYLEEIVTLQCKKLMFMA